MRSTRYSCLILSSLFTLAAGSPAFGGTTWTQPTPDELKMTSDPKAPDAAAVFLNREEIVDDKTHFHRLYARIKILTEKGKELAESSRERHRLILALLQKIGVSEETAESDAEGMEHHVSEETLEAIRKYLA